MRKDKPTDKKIKRNRLKYRSFLILMVSLILLGSIAVVAIGSWLLITTGVVSSESLNDSGYLILLFVSVCIVIAISLSILLGKMILKPVNTLIKGLNELSNGNFKTQIKISSHEEFNKLSDSFNTLAKELSNTEIMRSDFINNFSHEFKTPLVSIKGLVALLKKDTISEEKKLQYIAVIEDELDRLTSMSTSVLQLTKIENQVILTDVSEFNLSEQLRMCIILLEKKWEKKNLELKLDFEEYTFKGNEDLLKEVWLNLLDNAIKFAYPKTVLEIKVKKENDSLILSFIDEGLPIPKENLDSIFNKFFRTKESSSTEGHGIGLSIVKHIIELHKGSIKAESTEENKAIFTVTLPYKI